MKLVVRIVPTIKNRPKDFRGLYSADYSFNNDGSSIELAELLGNAFDLICDWWVRMEEQKKNPDTSIEYMNAQLEVFKEKLALVKFEPINRNANQVTA